MIKQIYGVYDCLSAKLALDAGADYFYLGGFSTAGSLLGVPDVGILTCTDLLYVAKNVKKILRDKYLIVDGDTGFGGDENIKSFISDLIDLNINAVTLEDQKMPKKCGHMPVEHKIVSIEEHSGRIKTAKNVINQRNSSLDIIARTDIRNYGTVDDVIKRASAYIKAGADIIFLEAIKDEREFIKIRHALPNISLLANIPESTNKTQLISSGELEKIGIDYILHPLSAMLSSIKAMQAAFNNLKTTGAAKTNEICSLDEYFKIIELDKYI
tara:strand:+ start:1658 stop:2467 length:810 start_codon:yes stop_codon:yes gene_type:complete